MPTNIIIDMRCLQDPYHAERGIPAHARNVISKAREVSSFACEAKIIGLYDPRLPEVEKTVREIADEMSPNAYFSQIHNPCVYLSPSPMTLDQGFVARILAGKKIFKAALIYDFIPFDQPEDYMTPTWVRLDYLTSYVWLKQYDMFLPISAPTESRLREIYDISNKPSVVTGVHIAPWLENGSNANRKKRHILTITGNHIRKNPEVLIKAHASSTFLQKNSIPLIIVGNYPNEKRQQLRDFACQWGGKTNLVEIPGKVTNEILLDYYQQAICVVTPSRSEGFSMPVVEAMAMGVPSIASDIAAHAELIQDSGLRFSPDDYVTLQALLEKIVIDAELREGIIQSQKLVWPKFSAASIAETVWHAIENGLSKQTVKDILPSPALIVSPPRPQIALLTPLSPARSGIADHSARLKEALSERVMLSVFSTNPTSGVLPISSLAHLAPKFDRVLSIMGNSPNHFAIYDLLLRYGGACICHDARLFHFSMSKYGINKTAEIASDEMGRKITAQQIKTWERNEDAREANFLGGLAQAASPLIFHNRQSVANVKERFGKIARYLPFALYRHWPNGVISNAQRHSARQRLSIATTDPVIVSLGFIQASKGIEAALMAMASLQQAGVACQLYWVGQAHQDITMFKKLALELGISKRVHFTDRYLTEGQYCDYVEAADYGLQLRLGSGGNISGALCDCIAAGLPTVASADIAENINAPSFVLRVASPLDPRKIAAGLLALMDGVHNSRAEEHAEYCAKYSMQGYVDELCHILEL